MALITFGENKKRDVVLIGRVTLDFNPNEMNRTLDKVKTFSMYLGGSPGNMAVGINKLGKSVGFIGCVSDDQFGDLMIAALTLRKWFGLGMASVWDLRLRK